MQQWSTATVSKFCRAKGKGTHYDLGRAGVWADCVREKKTIVHNDYLSLADRRGLPEGHADLVRELVVPVIREGKVTAILGIGNKAEDYTQEDIYIVEYLADAVWNVVRPKQAEAMLKLQKDIETACAELSARLLTTRDLAEVSGMILDTAARFTKSSIGFIGSIDSGSGNLVLHAFYDKSITTSLQNTPAPVFAKFTGLWGWVLENRLPLLTNHAKKDARSGGFPAGHAVIESFLGVPVIIGGEVLGIVALANPENSFLETDQALSQRLADLYALALLQRYTLEKEMIEAEVRRAEELEYLVDRRTAELNAVNAGLLAEIEERKRTETALTAEKETAQLYLDIARVGFVALDPEGRITMINRYLRHILGYDHQELLGRCWDDFLLPPEHRTVAAIDSIPGFKEKGRYGYHENSVRTKSGEVRMFAWNDESLYCESGDFQGILCSGEDITNRVQAEEQLHKSRFYRDIFAAVLHNTPLAMVFFVSSKSDKVRILDWNRSAERIFGWSKEEVLGRDFFEFLPYHEDTGEVIEVYRHLREKPGAHNLVNRCNSKSGEQRLLHWFNNSFADDDSERTYVVSLGHDMTQQYAYEERLRQSEEQLRTIAEFTYDWEEWRAPDGNYLYVSPSCERITGYTREEFLADSSLLLAIIHPDDQDSIAHHILHDQAVQSAHLIDFRIVTREGIIRWISHCCQPVYDEQGKWLGRRGSNRDITDRKDAEQQLLESRNMLQMVFDGIREPLLLMEGDGTILMMNKAAYRYFRIVSDEVFGRKCWDLACFHGFCGDPQIFQIIRSGESNNYERKGTFDGSRIERVNIDILSGTGEHAEMAIVRIHDITMEKQLEKDLMQADKMISLGTLVSGVAHEINNPNNFISLNVNLLKDAWQSLKPVLEKYHLENGDFLVAGLPYSEMKEDIPNLMTGIEAGARRIQKIIRELREYSIPSQEKMDEILHINSIVQQAVSLIGTKTSEFTDNLTVEYGSNLPSVKGSSQKLEQVLINLILNACQSLADRKKGIRLTTSYDRESETLCVVVQDEGRGIPESMMSHIMDPFFTTNRNIGGTGLGLSVSSRIIAEHHGRIEVTSDLQKGSTFIVRLPILK